MITPLPPTSRIQSKLEIPGSSSLQNVQEKNWITPRWLEHSSPAYRDSDSVGRGRALEPAFSAVIPAIPMLVQSTDHPPQNTVTPQTTCLPIKITPGELSDKTSKASWICICKNSLTWRCASRFGTTGLEHPNLQPQIIKFLEKLSSFFRGMNVLVHSVYPSKTYLFPSEEDKLTRRCPSVTLYKLYVSL